MHGRKTLVNGLLATSNKHGLLSAGLTKKLVIALRALALTTSGQQAVTLKFIAFAKLDGRICITSSYK